MELAAVDFKEFYDSHEILNKYYELGDKYFWIASNCDMVIQNSFKELKENRAAQPLILDAGSGFGSIISRLLPYGKIISLDVSYRACFFCKQQYDIEATQAFIEKMPFKDGTFDFVFLMSTLEHLKDDVEALKELRRILKNNGFCIITVPAFMCLWGYHDKKYGHLRRYTKYKLSSLAEKTGFLIKESKYYKFLPFFPLFLVRCFKKFMRFDSDDLYRLNPFVNMLFHNLLKLELFLVRKVNLPFGTHLFSILVRSSNSQDRKDGYF